MPLELLVFWGLICLVFILLAEIRPQFKLLGILGCILLIPLAFWIWTSGVEIQTGQVTVINQTTNTTLSGSTITGTDTTSRYFTAASLPYADIKWLISLILFAVSIYGSSHYALNINPDGYSHA